MGAKTRDIAVGLVGVGQIGSQMAERLVSAGFELTGHARSRERRRWLEERGAAASESLSDVARGSQIVLICVRTDDQVPEVTEGGNGLITSMEPGSAIVIHTTGRPRTAQRVANLAKGAHIQVVDAPVSGSVADVRNGEITLLVGGERTSLEFCRPVLRTYADPILHVGPLGMGQALKLINNLLLAANVQLAAEALRLAHAVGFPPQQLAATLFHCSGSTRALSRMSAEHDAHPTYNRMRPFLTKDISVAAQVAAEMDLDLGFLGEVARNGPAQFGAGS